MVREKAVVGFTVRVGNRAEVPGYERIGVLIYIK